MPAGTVRVGESKRVQLVGYILAWAVVEWLTAQIKKERNHIRRFGSAFLQMDPQTFSPFLPYFGSQAFP